MQISFTPLEVNGETATVGCRANFFRGIHAEHRSATFKLRTRSAHIGGKIYHLDYQLVTLIARKPYFKSSIIFGLSTCTSCRSLESLMVIFTQEKTGTNASAVPFKLHGDGRSKQAALQLM